VKRSVNRIPYEYFITSGVGSSDLEVHAGSYHVALYDAKICDYNIQTYSSVLPEIAKEIDITKANMTFGSELYTIMSCVHGTKGEYISCGVIIGDLVKDYEKIGSLVCEVSGQYDKDLFLVPRLHDVINDLHQKTYQTYNLSNIRYYTKSYVPEQKYGTCLVALCFTSFKS